MVYTTSWAWLTRDCQALWKTAVEKGAQFSWPGFPGPASPMKDSRGREAAIFPAWLPRTCLALKKPTMEEEAQLTQLFSQHLSRGICRRGWCNFPHLFPHGLSGPTKTRMQHPLTDYPVPVQHCIVQKWKRVVQIPWPDSPGNDYPWG